MKHLSELKSLLALELNCKPEDFGSENLITEAAVHEGRRVYSAEPYFFHMATLGENAVITAAPQLHGFLREWSEGRRGFELFHQPNLPSLEAELRRFGYTLTESYHMFLPQKPAEISANFNTVWFENEEIHRFYGSPDFPNAICDRFHPERPDRIAVCALIDDEAAGMAGCSEDAKGFQQIGIDVLPKYRSMGVGAFLVAALKAEIERRGDIPFYGTTLSNLHSWKIAIKCGFRPAWVEIGCKKI